MVTKCLKPWSVSFVIPRYSILTAQSLMDPTDYVHHDDDDDGFAKKMMQRIFLVFDHVFFLVGFDLMSWSRNPRPS